MNPVSGLFRSRKFLTLILDTIISTVILVGGWYLAPQAMEKTVAVIAIYQPVFIALIAAIASEDNAERRLQGVITSAQEWRLEEKAAKESESDGAG